MTTLLYTYRRALLACVLACFSAIYSRTIQAADSRQDWIEVGSHQTFRVAGTDERFVPWGFNYDHDASGRLLEDY